MSGSHIFSAREVDLSFDHPIKVNTDGEVLTADRCQYQVRPQAARFIVGDMGDNRIQNSTQATGSPERKVS